MVLGLDTCESIEFIDYKITNLSDHPIEAI